MSDDTSRDDQDDVDDTGDDDTANRSSGSSRRRTSGSSRNGSDRNSGSSGDDGRGDDDIDSLRKQLADVSADRDQWKTRSRKHEDRAKANADDAKAKQTLDEQIAELRQQIEQRDAQDVADKADMAAEKLHAALVRGGLSDTDAAVLVGTIDPVRLLSDGKPDTGEIKKLADSLTKIGTRPAPDGDQGRRGGDQPPNMNSLIRRAANRTSVG